MNIDEIFDLLRWDKPEIMQQKGITAAREIQNFYILIRPGCNIHIWDNCAIVVSEKNDMELYPYIIMLLEWIRDLTWPGADIILERLKNMDADLLEAPVYCSARDALALQYESWLRNLMELCDKNEGLKQKMDLDLYQKIVYFLEEMDKDE